MFVRLLDPRTGELLREHLSSKRGGLSRFREFGQRDEWKDCSSASH
jgi:hypothetical protein